MKKYASILVLLMSSIMLWGQFTAREVSRTGDIPDLISFQGRLTDNMGNPLNSNIDIIFKIYDAETGGTAIWMEDRNVQVTDGLFQLNLGEDLPLNESYFSAETRWLGVTIAADAEMTPRIRIASAPYALNALETDPTWSGDPEESGAIGRSGYVGIGTTNPSHNLDIDGLVRIRGGSPGVGKVLTSDSHGVGSWEELAVMTETDPTWSGEPNITGTISRTGDIGIGVENPWARLHVNGANFLVSGSHGSSPAINLGGGTKMFFNPRKSAFRAGWAAGLEWDDANIGEYSMASGYMTIANAFASTAFGQATEALGNNSTAFGIGSVASGMRSTAMGDISLAEGTASTAIGSQTEAFGERSTAMGYQTTAMGDYSTSMGYQTAAVGEKSTAMGSISLAGGYASTAMGSSSRAVGDYSFAVNLDTVEGPQIPAHTFQISNAQKTIVSDGDVGIGTSSPLEKMHIEGANFLSTGTFASSPELNVANAGTRMFFYPRKGAFRAGRVTGSQWNDVSIGDYSTAMGLNTIASGIRSTALGNTNTASGDYSTALGSNTTASGSYATAMGVSTTAQGNRSTAMGNFSEANGLFSTAMGNYTVAGGSYSTAMGSQTIASGDYSTAMGRSSRAVGNSSFAVNLSGTVGPEVPANTFQISGANNTIISKGNFLSIGTLGTDPSISVSDSGTRMFFYPRKSAFRAGTVSGVQWDDANIGTYSVAMGYDTEASEYASTALGFLTRAESEYSTAMGYMSVASGDYATAIGSSTATGYSSIAMGFGSSAAGFSSMAIGDANFASGQNSTAMGSLSRAIGNYSFAINLNDSDGPDVPANTFQISGATNTIISTGNVGIGTVSPDAKLQVMGGDAIINGHTVGRGLGAIDTNIAVGNQSLSSNTTGHSNSVIGSQALQANTSGYGNAVVGIQALYSNTEGDKNVAIGNQALWSNTTGNDNISIGNLAMWLNQSGNNNIAIGPASLYNNQSGSSNIAIGQSALSMNSTGSNNLAIGYQALSANTGGNQNTATGYQALRYNNSGGGNTAYGYQALTANTSGVANTAYGNNALSANTTGSYNTAVGSSSGTGRSNITGGTFLGYDAGSNFNGLTNVTAIGYGAKIIVNASNQVRLGDTGVTSFYCDGAYNGAVGTTNRDVYVDDQGKIGYVSSSRRYKDNIRDMDSVQWLYQLRPVNFTNKADEAESLQFGLIAEEVEHIRPEFVSYNDEGLPETVSYSALITPLLKAVQDQQLVIETQQLQIDELMQTVRELKELIEQ